MKLESYILQRAGAEFIGTYALVTAGCGAIMVNSLTGGELSHLGVSLAFGLVITVMIASTGHISGAHFNPAVTLAFSLIHRFSWRDVIPYISAQLGGATLGAITLLYLFGSVSGLGATFPKGDPFQSFVIEILLTAVLMFVITGVSRSKSDRLVASLTIGATVALDALWGGPISGASMNPARSFGPALVSGNFSHHWIYWLGPIIGAVVGAFAFEIIQEPFE